MYREPVCSFTGLDPQTSALGKGMQYPHDIEHYLFLERGALIALSSV